MKPLSPAIAGILRKAVARFGPSPKPCSYEPKVLKELTEIRVAREVIRQQNPNNPHLERLEN